MTPTTSDPGTVTRTRVETVPLPGSRGDLARRLFGVAAAYVLLLLGAVAGAPWLFAVGALAAVLGELALGRTRPFGWVLGEVRLGPPVRLLARGLLAVTLLGRCHAGGGALSGAAVGWLAVVVLTAAAYGTNELISLLRKAPVLSRGLDLGDLGVPRSPSAWLVDERTPALADAPLLVGVVAVAAGASGVVLAVGLALAVVAGLLLLAVLGGALRRLRRSAPRRRVPEAIAERVIELAPEVVLYHAGEPATAYQVESWLGVVEQLGRPAMVLLRDPATLRALAQTSLPVVCIPAATTLVGFELPGVRVGLFVANGTGNIHLLRRGGIGFAFVGHGDSDKASSSTPFARVYDEVWVAGPAGRERYERSGSRLAPGAVVEVGRPQLAGLTRGPRTTGGPPTVLYAPTWEGWGEEPYHSSLVHGGVELVRRLLAEPDLRVIYRPHPLAGSRDTATRQAHQAILDLMRGSGATVLPDRARPAPGRGDDLDRCFEPVAGHVASAGSGEGYGDEPAAGHLVVGGQDPGLLFCLERSDLLVADVSAVVSDWLATGRPYAILNPSGLPAADLHAAAPSTAAAVLVGPELAELDGLLFDLRTGVDPLREARAALAEHLLGPSGEDALGRFRAALTALGERVSTEHPGARPAPGTPGW
jgi:hypothetical protein